MKHISIKTLLDFYLKIGCNWAFWIFLQLSQTATLDSNPRLDFVSFYTCLPRWFFSSPVIMTGKNGSQKNLVILISQSAPWTLVPTQTWTPGSEDLQLFGLCIGLQLSSRPKPPLKTLLTMQFLDSQTKHHDLQSSDLPSPHLHAEQVPDGMRSAIPGHLTCYVFALRLNYSEGQRHSMGLRIIQCLNLMFAGFLYTHWFLCVVLKNNSSAIAVPVTLRALIICIMGLSALPQMCVLWHFVSPFTWSLY